MVCDREAQTGGGADRVLVAEPGGLPVAAQLRAVLPEGLGLYLCLRFYLDSLHPQPGHSPAACGGAPGLSRVAAKLCPPHSKFCFSCGARLRSDAEKASP